MKKTTQQTEIPVAAELRLLSWIVLPPAGPLCGSDALAVLRGIQQLRHKQRLLTFFMEGSIMVLSRARVVGLSALIAVNLMMLFGYFGTYRAQRVTLPVSEGQVQLNRLGDEWETLCIIGPYANNATAKEITGLSIDIEGRSRISMHDSIALLAVLDGRGGHRLFEVPRDRSDFTQLSGTCWPKGASFSVQPSGHPYVQAK